MIQMIEAWKWNGKEPSLINETPAWIVEAYERGKILTISDRKTNDKYINVHTKYGDMRGKNGCWILRLNFQNFMVLDDEDCHTLRRQI